MRRSQTTAAAPMILEARVGMATPSTPMWKPKIKRALPPTLMMFIPIEIRMETEELPMTRKRAAPALYSAIKGIDASTMMK